MFSRNYRDARERFRSLAVEKGHYSDLKIDVSGPDGEPLSIGACRLPGLADDRLLIISSGIHGVEGFAGSAIQCDLLRNYGETCPVPVVMLHCVNPYGMAWLRRTNESNVDLNRGFVTPPIEEKAPNVYEHLYDFINPGKANTSRLIDIIKLLYHAYRYGIPQLEQAITRGQRKFPKGLFYGGNRLEQGPRRVIGWLQSECFSAGHKIKEVCLVDIHTGLGKRLTDTLITHYRHKDPAFQKLRQHMSGRLQARDQGGHKLSVDIEGSMIDALPGMLTDTNEVEWFAMVQEFGTRSKLQVLSALRRENSYHHNEPETDYDLSNPHKQKLLDAFYLQSDREWKEYVLRRGRDCFRDALHLLATKE